MVGLVNGWMYGIQCRPCTGITLPITWLFPSDLTAAQHLTPWLWRRWLDIASLADFTTNSCKLDFNSHCCMKAADTNQATPRHDTRAQFTGAAIAFGELSDTLGCVQQQLGPSNTLPLWRGILFMQKLKTWLYNLPDELSVSIVHGLERWDLGLIKNVFSEASDTRKVELVRTQTQNSLLSTTLLL